MSLETVVIKVIDNTILAVKPDGTKFNIHGLETAQIKDNKIVVVTPLVQQGTTTIFP